MRSGVACLLMLLCMASANAQDNSDLGQAVPIEVCAFNYHQGKGQNDLDAVVAKWNAWADSQKISDFSAWTLAPYYFDQKQDFDFIWLGVSPTAASLGRTQDKWIATGSAVAEEFNKFSTCGAHSNFASFTLKAPSDVNYSNAVVSISDCNLAGGMMFQELIPSLKAWAEYRKGHGSTGGMWVLFPAYGGEGESFEFKFVAAHGSLEEQGVDYDEYYRSGARKAQDLFAGKLSCDSPRVYLAQRRRQAEGGDAK